MITVLTGFFLLTAFQVVIFKYVNPSFTVNMVWEWGLGKLKHQPAGQPLYIWKSLEDISPHLQRAVLASEDQRFLSHHGFDFIELEKALKDIIFKKRVRGASTITMQTARTLYLVHGRNIFRKIAEAYYTVIMELFWSKKRILEVYLNTVDWGAGIMGAEAAAMKYFSCGAGELNPSQASLMAAILPSPHKWSVKNPGEYVKSRQARIMKNMRAMPVL